MKYIATVNEQEYVIEVDQDNQITVDDQPYGINFNQLSEGGVLSLLLDSTSFEAVVEERDATWKVLIHGELYTVKVQDERAYRLAKARGSIADFDGEAVIKSPMPGLIVAVPVEKGQQVKKGEQIVILESMKMENELRSPRDGVVTNIYVKQGSSVEKDQILATVGDEAA